MRPAALPLALAGTIALLMVLPGLAVAAAPAPSPSPWDWGKVDARLAARLAELGPDGDVEFLLRLSAEATLEDVKFQRSEVVERLKSVASASQPPLRSQLEAQGFAVKRSFWIVNYLLVEGPGARVGTLTTLPQVDRLVDNFDVTLADGTPGEPVAPTATLTWGLEKVRVEEVWTAIGTRGADVRVCVSDTGVDETHPDLEGRMWSDAPGDPAFPGGWIEFDSSGNPVGGSTPHDTHGHGTHTSGTVLGGEDSGVAIGMAPEAALMHALVLPGGGGSFAQVIAGIEWCVDPTDENGSPAGQPADVHSMSWGATGYYDEDVEPILNSYLAGTVPVASAGNSGEGSSGTPGNLYDALGIGASDVNDNIAAFSSGEVVQRDYFSAPPAHWPDEWTVPLVSAPGVSVYSSLPGGGYAYWDGTSMAAPHVAGCAALMASANPTVTPDDVRDALVSTAHWYDTYYPGPPDTRYGWGVIDCYDAVELVAYNSGIRGVVRDQEDGELLPEAQVNVTGPSVLRTRETDADGAFKLSLKPGSYNVSVGRFGFTSENLGSLVIGQDEWVDLDVALAPLPRGNVTGLTFHNATAIPVPGTRVSVEGVPVTLESTTGAGGTYALRKVPEGTYTLRASSPYFREALVAGVTVVGGGNATADIAMDPRDRVAVIGDHSGSLTAFLEDHDYYVEEVAWWQVTNDACRYRTVVANHEYVSSTDLDDFLAATDAAGTGVLFLDTWEHTWWYGGIYNLYLWRSDPAVRGYGYDSSYNQVHYNVTQAHPVLAGHSPGDVVVLENSTIWHDYAWFDAYVGENGTVIANAGSDLDGEWGPGIAVDDRANNRHVLLSLHGASSYVTPGDWTDAGADVFLNAMEWARGPGCADALPVDHDLTVSPAEGLWSETFQVGIQVVNVGAAAGNYTASLYVDGWLEQVQTVALASGEQGAVAFDVARDPVGTYSVAIGPHEDSFRVRPPLVTVDARDADGGDLANAAVTVGLGSAVMTMGSTDAAGDLAFDSPAGSHGQYWVALQAEDATGPGDHYFLSQELYIEDDTLVSFAPTANDTALLDLEMTEAAAAQSGSAYLRRTDMPAAYGDAYPYPEGTVRVDRATYSARTRTVVEGLQATWGYETSDVVLDLSGGGSDLFRWGGAMETSVDWTQVGSTAVVDWAITDGHGNDVVRVTQSRFGTLEAGETTEHQPFVSLWNAQGGLLASGYVGWTQRPVNATVPENESVAYVQVDLDTGTYPLANTFSLEVHVHDSGNELTRLDATADAAVEVTGSALLAGAPVPVAVSVNGEAAAVDANGSFALTVNLTKGFNTLNVTAVDVAGNVEEVVYVIVSKPDVALRVNPLPALVNVSPLEVAGMVEADATLTVNGAEVFPDPDGLFVVELALQEGGNDVVVAAVDYLGNRKEIARHVVLDTVPPEILVQSPAPGERTYDESITLVGRTEPTATLRIDGDVVPLDEGDFVHQVSLPSGAKTIVLEVADEAGNVRTTSLTVYREALILGAPGGIFAYLIPAVAAGAVLGTFFWTRWRIARARRGAEGPPAAEAPAEGDE